MSSKINNYLLKIIMKLIIFCVVGIYSAPAWTGNNQVEAAPADSEQVISEKIINEQDNELLAETEALIEDLKAKSKDANLQ